MRIIRGDYEHAKKLIKDDIYAGYSVDKAFSKAQFSDLNALETTKLYADVKASFDNTIMLTIDQAYNAVCLSTNSSCNMSHFIDAIVVDKMIKKFKSNAIKDLGLDKITKKDISDMSSLMQAGAAKVAKEETEVKNNA